jgi:acyl-CoA synthetase (NDP forming)
MRPDASGPTRTTRSAAIARLFNARSIAVVGASADLRKLSAWPLNSLRTLGFQGRAWAVNPARNEVLGYPSVPAVRDLPEGIDAALIALPAAAAVEAAEACVAHGIRALVIVAQGFGEAGEDGQRYEARLRALGEADGVAICGPNTNGLSNVKAGYALSFAPILQIPGRVKPGPVAVVSQSGGTVSTILDKLGAYGVGISKTVTCGNETVLALPDYLEAMAEDDETSTIVVFLETIRAPDRLRSALARCRAAGKRMVAMKIGESESGQRATISHTGAIAGSWRNTVAFLRGQGVQVAEDLDTLAALAACGVASVTRAQAAGNLAVLSISGGFAALIADAAARHGMPLAAPSARATAALAALDNQSLPINPYDIAGQNAVIPAALAAFREDGFGAVLMGLGVLYDTVRKPILSLLAEDAATHGTAVFVVSPHLDEEDRKVACAGGLVTAPDHMPLLRALREIAQARTSLAEAHAAYPATGEPRLLDEAASKAILAAAGIAVPRGVVLPLSAAPDNTALVTLHPPLALKGLSRNIAHKSEHGLVQLGLATLPEVAAAWQRIAERLAAADPESRCLLAEEMVPGGLEAFAGVQRDPVVGPILVCGAGGVLAELLDDVVVLALPCAAADIDSALDRTRFARLLDGYRGRNHDRAALVAALDRLAALALARPDILSIDVNPLFVLPGQGGVMAADAKVILQG